MGRRPRPFRIGPPTRGLTDFPERATPEHSTQALNVEFVNGGVSTRRGTVMKSDNFYEDSGATVRAATIKLVHGFTMANGAEMVAVGLVPTAGAEEDEERLLIRWKNDFGSAGGVATSVQLTAPDARTNDEATSRWDACTFKELEHEDPTLIVCTDHGINANARVFFSEWGAPAGPTMTGLTGVNRTVTPYHGGDVPGSAYSDDPGTYYTGEIRARHCRTHRGRLILANFTGQKVDFGAQENALWFSNLADVRGWASENVRQPAGGDMGPITGLASRGDYVVVFRRGSVSLFRIGDTTEWGTDTVYRQVVSDRGCIAHGTIVDDVQGMTCFLSQDGFYGFDGTNMHHLSEPIERTMRKAIQAGGVGGSHATHYPQNRQVWLSIPSKGNGEPDTVYVMDYSAGYNGKPAWSMFQFQSSTWSDQTPPKRLVGFCTYDGGSRIYGVHLDSLGLAGYERYDVGDAIDQQTGSTIGFRSLWESGPIGYGSNDVFRWRFLRPTVRPTMTNNLTAWWRLDNQAYDMDGSLNGQSAVFAPDADDAGGGALGAFVLGTDRLGSAEDHSKRVDIHSGGTGRYGRIGVRTDATTSHKFDIRGVEIDVISRGRTRR